MKCSDNVGMDGMDGTWLQVVRAARRCLEAGQYGEEVARLADVMTCIDAGLAANKALLNGTCTGKGDKRSSGSLSKAEAAATTVTTISTASETW